MSLYNGIKNENKALKKKKKDFVEMRHADNTVLYIFSNKVHKH